MSEFLTSMDVRLLSDTEGSGGSWMLVSPLVYQSDVAAITIEVPSLFVTDFASVPRVPPLFDLMGDMAHAAAALHDYLYTTGSVPRSLADRVLREAAVISGVAPWRAQIMYLAVRIFGASHYEN